MRAARPGCTSRRSTTTTSSPERASSSPARPGFVGANLVRRLLADGTRRHRPRPARRPSPGASTGLRRRRGRGRRAARVVPGRLELGLPPRRARRLLVADRRGRIRETNVRRHRERARAPASGSCVRGLVLRVRVQGRTRPARTSGSSRTATTRSPRWRRRAAARCEHGAVVLAALLGLRAVGGAGPADADADRHGARRRAAAARRRRESRATSSTSTTSARRSSWPRARAPRRPGLQRRLGPPDDDRRDRRGRARAARRSRPSRSGARCRTASWDTETWVAEPGAIRASSAGSREIELEEGLARTLDWLRTEAPPERYGSPA